MADLTITVVKLISTRVPSLVTMIEAITPFEVLYKDAATSKYGLADADDTAKDVVAGMSLINSDLDGPGMLLISGDRINVGAILTKGTLYCLSATPGKIAPLADAGVGDAVVPLFIAETTSTLTLQIFNAATTIIL